MLTTREQLTVLDHLINLKLQVKMYPPYHKDPELLRIKKRLEEDIAFEEVKNVQTGGDRNHPGERNQPVGP